MNTRWAPIGSALLFLFGAVLARGQLVISNATTQVNFNPASGLFSVMDFASGRTFVSQGNFNETNGTAAIIAVTNATFGQGRAIQFSHSDGNSDVIMLYSNVPFALFQSTLANGSAQTVVSNKIHTLTALVDLSEPAGNLKTMGTGGLLSPSSNPGSYEWLAVADPTNRNGVVSGWVTDDRGSGVVFGKVNGNLVQMDAQIDYGRLQFLPGQTNALEIFALGYFDDARVGLETWADEIARVYDIHLPPQPDGYCTYPSSPNGGASSPAAVAQLTDFVKTNLEAFGFSMIQIDAGWQGGITTTNGSNHGPTRVFTEYTNNYSAGVKPTADYMLTNGITPGIWFEPFAGTSDDPYFTNHEDWFVETTNGTPYWAEWGGNCLDMTYPPARDYVSNMVSNLSHNWDFQYFKMDGLWTGSATPLKYVNSGYSDDHMGDAVFANPAVPNIEAFRDGLKLVRQAAGTNVFLLGCNIAQNMRSYGGTFGLLDAMRIGPDNSASWSGWLRSPQYGSRHYFLQGRVWYNDPDTLYVRSSFTSSQAQAIASWYGISGQLTLDGDWIPGLAADRLDILKRVLPHHGLLPRPVDYFENDPPNIWLLTEPASTNAPRRDVVGIFNWSTSASLNIDVSLAHLGLPTNTDYAGFDFWSNSPAPTISGRLQTTVPPASCRILAVRPVSTVPQLISTSRHVTQGIVSVLAENWDGTNTLSGISRVVGGDPYELRILTPSNGWKAQNATVSAADQAADVTVSCLQSNELVRATLQSLTNREVAWSVAFVLGPSVTLTSPTNGAVFYTNAVIVLAADASAPSGQVAGVDFYRNATKVGSATSEPFVLSISNQPAGTSQFSAVVTDNVGNSTTSTVVLVQIIGSPPSAPSNLTASPGNGQVFLNWSGSSGATDYSVKRATVNGGPYVTIASVTTTSFTDTTVSNRRAYYYVVAAVNPIGESADSAQASATPTDLEPAGLVACLNFDDGTAGDSSGNGNNGVLVNGAAIVNDPERGEVLSLDGVNQYVDLGNASPLDLSTGGQATITAWVKVADTHVHNSIVTKGEWREAYSLLVKGDTAPPNLLWTGNDTSVFSSDPVPTGVWTHVAVTINGALTTFYINGQLNGATNQNRGNPIDQTTTDVCIGREQYSGSLPAGRWFFNGELDDVRIYNVALTRSEIQNVMSNVVNHAPAFASHPLVEPAVEAGHSYVASIGGNASDPDPGDTITFSKVSGPVWLNVAANGGLSGTPLPADAGTNSFLVRVTDSSGYFDEATLNITVIPAPPQIINVTLSGENLIFSGTNGAPGRACYVLASTSLALPLANWARVATNTFDSNGEFNFTNSVQPDLPQSFYLLQLP